MQCSSDHRQKWACHKRGMAAIILVTLLAFSEQASGQVISPYLAFRQPNPEQVTEPTEDGDVPEELEEVPLTPEEEAEATRRALEALGEALERPVIVPALEQEVTVARQQTTVGRSASAIFVVTQEMIRRSGARTIPDILRMVPGVHVSQLDANKWSVGIRGFDRIFDDKLEVRIDGRSAYTPLFGGVYWDVQDVVLADIERIEVIRGPGPSVYSANTNGIINIITKTAHDTQGGLFVAGGGTEERGFGTMRYGSKIGKDASWRIYGKGFERDQGFDPDNVPADDWRQQRVGFRMDWNAALCDTVTVQGDYYTGFSGQRSLVPMTTPSLPPPLFLNDQETSQDVEGGNAIVRWNHKISDDSSWTLQTYFDHTERVGNESYTRDTFDVDLQYNFRLDHRQKVIVGAQHRVHNDDFAGTFQLDFDPQKRTYGVTSAFVQDEIAIVEDSLYFTAGTRFEVNDFTGFEYQPSGRLIWLIDERQAVWGAISRAIRRPSRANEDQILHLLVPRAPLPIFFEVSGNPNLKAEDLMAYEIGYRAQPSDIFSWDISLFFNRYNNVETVAGTGDFGMMPVTAPLIFQNFGDVDTYGGEITANWQARDNWKMKVAYSLLQFDNRRPVGQLMEVQGGRLKETPGNATNIVYWQSSLDVTKDWDFDAILRSTSEVLSSNSTSIPGYITMDLRLAWTPKEHLEFSVVGRNLFDRGQQEFLSTTGIYIDAQTEVERSVYGMITYNW